MNCLNRILPFVLLHVCWSTLVCAQVLVVTSNWDSVPGVLRAALIKVAENGDNEIDYIHFNLPGADTGAHTIRLLTPLPAINSSLVIDGSTQPGDALSINGAKVVLISDMPEVGEETGFQYGK